MSQTHKRSHSASAHRNDCYFFNMDDRPRGNGGNRDESAGTAPLCSISPALCVERRFPILYMAISSPEVSQPALQCFLFGHYLSQSCLMLWLAKSSGWQIAHVLVGPHTWGPLPLHLPLLTLLQTIAGSQQPRRHRLHMPRRGFPHACDAGVSVRLVKASGVPGFCEVHPQRYL